MHKLSLRFPWHDKASGSDGCEVVAVEARHCRAVYGNLRFEAASREPHYPPSNSQANARASAHSALSRIEFMDLTGWRRSKSENGVLACCGSAVWPAGFDYETVWRCPASKRTAITVEPREMHLALVLSECKARGWPFHVFAKGVGLRSPTIGSRMILVSPGQNGVDIEPIAQTLERSLPRWEFVHA